MIFTTDPSTLTPFPDHTQLPESDGTFVKNFQEHPQSILITESIKPILQKRHPDGQYCIGQDSGIYWRMTDPPERGAEAPDWFYVPNVPPSLNGQFRRSYVLWQEYIAPLIVLEFVSGSGAEERDKTPWTGKFWVYEQVIHPAFYGIYEVNKASIEVYHLIEGKYQLLPANERGHYPISALGIELGIWQGEYQNMELPWLRLWDLAGNLLLSGEERAEQEYQRAELEMQRAELERQKAEQERQNAEREYQNAERERQKNDRLIAQLRSLGIEPEV
ncbi:Uma2 family endonuclease [Dolichospermum sp. ST_sed1]|nr:Uma2 family endonuclease [Dolichospermum sp. ST_sed1]MDD1423088.1 Uma2 family endonuclease [Dolichospermum sp. ST_sed9]MDD1432211.1 Uma2 family endonuclease [Dolichospermum sp. ST_sed6]MDD1436037.1 Uma2 family endonuclease [Dolichospermum sp. ST_sed10]MDD1442995.1 Uma2 family endonuclease [Dolichospermum sp. ST_sed3]MDD1444760.1 Uma2 family endonuclease [Dolichospermum sp. ST_sed8]MDD1456981.1 Uma2 family endonuclease [Dolichospermum sp. ST_sed7]MDD1462043.1 Uma2 family endonuclease [Doli